MAAILDSAAEFRARLVSFKLDEFAAAFTAAGVEAFADLAFLSPHTPNSTDDALFIADIVKPILGAEDHPKKGRLRRLFTEA